MGVVTMTQKRLRPHLAFSLMLAVLFLGCTRPESRTPIECEQLREVSLRLLPLSELDREMLAQWVKEHYQVDEVRRIASAGGVEEVSWKQPGKDYLARFRNDTFEFIGVTWAPLQPTIDEILECFGPPDLYEASYRQDVEAMRFYMAFWYLREGVIVSTSRFRKENKPPPITGDMTMTGLVLVPPGTAAEMVRYYPVEVRPAVLKSLQPWPGTVERIVVDSGR